MLSCKNLKQHKFSEKLTFQTKFNNISVTWMTTPVGLANKHSSFHNIRILFSQVQKDISQFEVVGLVFSYNLFFRNLKKKRQKLNSWKVFLVTAFKYKRFNERYIFPIFICVFKPYYFFIAVFSDELLQILNLVSLFAWTRISKLNWNNNKSN